jgi:hypothetical protein
MGLFSALFRRPAAAARTGRPARLGLEALEPRELPSASPLPAVNANPTIDQVARAEYRQSGSQLTRTDVVNLLNVVDGTERAAISNGQVNFSPVTPPFGGTLSAAGLSALETIFDHPRAWKIAGDVDYLAKQVVGYNPANETFNANPNLAPQTILPSGQLAAGDAVGLMQDLVGKWFYGSDLPSLAGSWNTGVAYEQASGTLFGPGGPSYKDVAQGWLADCYFLSTLGETAMRDPQAIRHMFINDGNGIYTVRFFEGPNQPVYVTVNSELPVDTATGGFVYANNNQYGHATSYTNPDNVLWVALAEKAYAELAAEGWSRNPDESFNAYSSLDNGWAYYVFQYLTGNFNASYSGAFSRSTIQTMIADFNQGDLITIGTDAAGHAGPLLDGGHVYMLEAVHQGPDLQDTTFTLVNPYYQSDTKSYGLRRVTVSAEYLIRYCEDFAYLAPPFQTT